MNSSKKFVIRTIYYIIFLIFYVSYNEIGIMNNTAIYIISAYLNIGVILSLTFKIPIFSRYDFYNIKNITFNRFDYLLNILVVILSILILVKTI